MEPGETSDVRYLTARQTTTADRVTAAGLGKRRALSDFTALEWAFLVVSVVNVLATVGLTIYTLVRVLTDGGTNTPDFTLTILVLVNAAFCFYYIFSSVVFEKKYELFVFLFAICVVVMYCTLEYAINAGGRHTVKLVRLIVAWVLAPLNIGLGIPVALNFRWLEFRIVGPSEPLQVMYREALWFICLLMFDLQVSYSIVALNLSKGKVLNTQEIVILSVGIVFCPLWTLLGWFTVRMEKISLVWGLFVLGLASPAYVIYRIVLIYQQLTDHSSKDPLLWVALAACALALLVRGLTFIEIFRVTRNFGKGLKEKIMGQKSGDDRPNPPALETAGDTAVDVTNGVPLGPATNW